MSDTKACLQRQLAHARNFTESLLADFTSPEQWVHQVHPQANHALWFAGHMGVNDNFFISILRPELADPNSEFKEHFGTGSLPRADASSYPPIEDVLRYMRERRQVLVNILEQLDDAALAGATPRGTPNFLPTMASIFETAVWHEGLHSGQLSVTRRSMGHEPVFKPG